MVYVEIFMAAFWLLFLIYDIVHKEGLANIVHDAIWLVDIIYLAVLAAKIVSTPVLCVIDLFFVALWGVDYFIQVKYDSNRVVKWLPITMSALFFVSFLVRIM